MIIFNIGHWALYNPSDPKHKQAVAAGKKAAAQKKKAAEEEAARKKKAADEEAGKESQIIVVPQPPNEAHAGEKNRKQQTTIPNELSVGAPVANPGVCCYVNSTFQALAHCPV